MKGVQSWEEVGLESTAFEMEEGVGGGRDDSMSSSSSSEFLASAAFRWDFDGEEWMEEEAGEGGRS